MIKCIEKYSSAFNIKQTSYQNILNVIIFNKTNLIIVDVANYFIKLVKLKGIILEKG